MAEGFEQFHVPQQSRRDKLRVVNDNLNQTGCVDYLQNCAPLAPLYDLITSPANLHRQSFNLYPNTPHNFKENSTNFMGFAGEMSMISPSNVSSSTPTNHNQHMYVDPQLNPNTIHDFNGAQYLYTPQSFHSNSSSQSLSLSLSSQHQNQHTNLPLELNLQRNDCNNSYKVNNEGYFGAGNVGSASIEMSRSTVPLGPFTGYASVLKKSRFLKPTQLLLEEICDVGSGFYAEKIAPDSSLLNPLSSEGLSGTEGVDETLSFGGGSEENRKKSRLLSMLDEVYKRYKIYYQQMQAVVSSFESVAGLSNAAPFASLALNSLSKHFKCLKHAITEQLQSTIKYHGKTNYERDESQRFKNSGMGPQAQRPFHSPRFVDQPIWRPQRGLPERAVSVLRAWLFEHFLHPYPTDTDKMMLAKQTCLSRNQVSNWFINARVRLWKPMVEEIHMLETRQSQMHTQRENEPPSNNNRLNDHMPTSSSVECEIPSTSFQGSGEFSLKRSREELTEVPRGSNAPPMNLPYENLSHHPHLGGAIGGNCGVSLTLGLHQNSMGLSESYPMNAARRFGLDAHGEGYMLSEFATQNPQYGRDVMG